MYIYKIHMYIIIIRFYIEKTVKLIKNWKLLIYLVMKKGIMKKYIFTLCLLPIYGIDFAE
ncbi:MAG: hypothetical protein AMJ79_10780 [Phycisphaerae bacterium SM23_30]|nr:MAG: hypothetical protein AMJ79_10780 [Phycisphaerae bacterium SM23_30]